jgi:AraC-like DNA-binding protein
MQIDLEPEFLAVYKKILPLVELEKKKKMTMRRLSNAAKMDAKSFYQLITANIYKSPRQLIKQARLQKAERMLRNTKEPIDVIAKECGFISVNYLIASFFHVYRVTPEQYRKKH